MDRALSFLGQQAPGADVWVVTAFREAADDLVREVVLRQGSSMGIRRMGLGQLTSWLAAEGMVGKGLAPVTKLGAEAVVLRAASEARDRGWLGRLAAVAGYPGFPVALAGTLNELRRQRVSAQDLEAVGASEVAGLSEVFAAQLAAGRLADRAQQTQIAIDTLLSASALGPPSVVFVDPPVSGNQDADLVRALIGRSGNALAVVPAGDVQALALFRDLGPSGWTEDEEPGDAPLPRLRRFLFSERLAPGRPEESIELFSAPGEARECAEIARRVLDAAGSGIPFDRMAVFVRSSSEYVDHLESAFRRARVPSYFAHGTRRPDPAGRAFLALLACRAEGLSARRFAEYLSFAQVPDAGPAGEPPAGSAPWVAPAEESLATMAAAAGFSVQLELDFAARTRPAPPDSDARPVLEGALRAPWKWEELLVEAAVIGGRDRWERRLRGLESELRVQRARAEADDPGSSRVLALARDLRDLGHLMRFARPVIEALDALPTRATWGDWLPALERLAPMTLRHPEHVLAVLTEMRPMATVGPVGIDDVRILLSPRLGSLETEPPGSRYGRVFVGPPEAGRGRSFAWVFIPGLAERLFPRRPTEDPILLDVRRRAIAERSGVVLETQNTRARDERLRLQLAVGAAEDRLVLSYPRLESKEGRPRVPSFYSLDLQRALIGELPDPVQLERDAERAGAARLAWPAPEVPDRAIDDIEHDLAVIGPLLLGRPPSSTARGRVRYLLEVNSHLARSLRARWARGRPRWHPADGIVRTGEAIAATLAAHSPRQRAYSVTSLERFARCPYQFLLAAIHRLEPRQDPVALVELDALTRGSMIHEILAGTIRELQREGLIPVAPERMEACDRILERVVDRVEAVWRDELAPAIPRVWDDEVRAMRADLRLWLRDLSERHAQWTPLHVEYTFGLGTPAEPAQGRPDPVVIEDHWHLHGAIDLIERSVAGTTLRVTDYKTGSNRHKPGATVAGGTLLQPALYALAVEGMFGRTVERAQLDFCTRRGGFTRHDIPLGPFQRLQARQALDLIERSLEAGTMPAAPRDGECRYCDFRPACGPGEQTRWRRKDPALLEPLVELRELP